MGVPNRDFFGRYADALGMRLPTLPTPLAKAASRLARDPDVNPRAVDYMLRTGTYSIAKARDLLGWSPRVGVDEGMERTLAWLREAGLVAGPGARPGRRDR
jgi:nucleoside-diphosphate-sugar epimerase